MKLKGGYNIRVAGRPAGTVEVLPEPDTLYLPLQSRRFGFSEICVKDGEQINPGHAVARDPENYSVPLLAPRAGTVRLDAVENHIVLEDVAKLPEETYHPDEDLPHVPQGLGSPGMKRYKLLALGAWQFFYDAHTGALPDPFGAPSAVIVSTIRLEPFLARGDVQVRKRLVNFTRGLEHIQALLEYQPIHLILPEVDSDLASKVRDTLRGYAWVNITHVPLRYPFDNFALLARGLGLKHDPNSPVWAINSDGVLAMDRALTMSHPCTVRLISLGGPAIDEPKHLKAMPGYPIEAIVDPRTSSESVRVLKGGGLTGDTLSEDQLGLDAECTGLTVLPEHTEREFLGFMRPGSDRRSYSKCFLSTLRAPVAERFTTALKGELRPCVSCNFCEELCPAGLMPHLIHKLLYQDELEQAELARIDLCVECGLCSFVCPSKLDLRREFIEGKQTIQEELHAEEVEA